MAKKRNISCGKHGEGQTATFVCQHIVASLETKKPRGFYWAETDHSKHPDAWCKECHSVREAAKWKWTAEVHRKLDIQILCSGCYSDAKSLWLRA